MTTRYYVEVTKAGVLVAHAASHKAGGSDAIKLDELATPDDNTNLNASATRHGLLPKLSNVATQFLNGLGNWIAVAWEDIVGKPDTYPPSAHNQDASTITTGILSTDRYSAYNDLTAESKIGTGAAQVAAGNHTHALDNLDGYIRQSTAIACRAYRNTTQSIASSTWTAIQLNAEYFDDVPSGVTEMHNNSTNNTRITCRVNGVYHIVGNVQWENDATGDRMTAIRLNGSTYVGLNTTRARVSGNTNVNVSTVIKMSAGDFVELMAYQDRGSSLNAVYDASNQHATVMSVVRIA